MSLHKIVAEAIDANEADGVINRQEAINIAVPMVLADEDMTQMCVRSHLSKVIASSCKKRAREATQASPQQSSFFGLHDAHVLDDGEGNIKHTSALTRIEFQRIINIRQDQVDADLTYLRKLRAAEMQTRPIWDAHPDWSWGQVEAEFARSQPQAA